jgi:hypothetical protein
MASQQDTHQLAAATAASVQALATALQQQSLQPGTTTQLSLPQFRPQELAAWFQHVEAEFLLAGVPLTSYLGYLHIIRALSPNIISSIRDVTRHLTAKSLDAYDAQLRALIPANGDVLFNAIFLCTLPEHIRMALASQAELPSCELATAAVRMQNTVHPTATIAAATPLPPPPLPSIVSTATQRPSRQDTRSSPTRYRRDTPYRDAQPAKKTHVNFAGTTNSSAATHNVVKHSTAPGKTSSGSGGNPYHRQPEPTPTSSTSRIHHLTSATSSILALPSASSLSLPQHQPQVLK